MEKLKEFITRRHVIQEMLKEVFQDERKRYEMEIWIYTKECKILENVATWINI